MECPLSRGPLVLVYVILLSTLLVCGAVVGQPLTATSCPAEPNPAFQYMPAPPLTTWVAGAGMGTPMLKHTIDLALYPDAVCNDGSAAVMYIRPANAMNPAAPASQNWLIFLDGGGSCKDPDECLLDRWCHGSGQVFDVAGKMSSTGAPDAIKGWGIFELNPVGGNLSAFRNYNHVLVHYCSSDNWIGSAEHLGLQTGLGLGFDIRFEGEAIVNAVFRTLLAGATAADAGPAAMYYATALPDLSTANTILLAGESAGGGGLRHHLDRLREEVLLPRLDNPEAEILGVIDAGFTPHLGGANIDWSDEASPIDYADYLASVVEPTVRDFWGTEATALDQSCLDDVWQADHELAGGHPEVCLDATYTLLNHITTPVFLREDINDPLGKQRYEQWNLYLSNDEYWSDLYAQLLDFAAYSPAGGGLEPPLASPSLLGIHCAQHVAVQTNPGFFRHRVTASGVNARTFHDLLNAWVASGGALSQVQVDALGPGLYTPSFCP